MPRAPKNKTESISPTSGAPTGIEGGQEGVDESPYVNGVAATTFADEEYPKRADSFDSDTIEWAESTPKPGKKRGPKPGTKRKPKYNPAEETLKSNLAIDKLTQGVAFIHMALAGALKIEELNMGLDEAGALVVASLDVMKEYDLTPDPKTAAWMNLVMVSATVYGTRVMAYQTRMKFAKNQTVETNTQ